MSKNLFQKELAATLKRLSLPVSAMARSLDLSDNSVKRWLRGKMPSKQVYARVCELYPTLGGTLDADTLLNYVPSHWKTGRRRRKKRAVETALDAGTKIADVVFGHGDAQKTFMKALVDVARDENALSLLSALLTSALALKLSLADLVEALWGNAAAR